MRFTRIVALLLTLAVPSAAYAQRAKTPRPRSASTGMSVPALPLAFTMEGVLPTFSSDGRYIVTQNDPTNNDKQFTKLWDATSGQVIFSMERRFGGLSPDSRLMTVSNGNYGLEALLELREIPSNRLIRSWKGGEGSFSPDSKVMAAWTWENTRKHTRISETETGNLLDSLDGEFLAFSGDGQYMAIETDDNTDNTLLWDVANKQSLRLVDGKFVGFSRDGHLIATKTKTLVKIYETVSGRLQSSVDCWGEARFSPDGQVIATEVFDYKRSAKDSITKLWETKTGRLLATLDGPLPTFSPTGQIMATETTDRKATKLWEAMSGKFLNLLEGGIRGFSSDGQLLTTEIWWEGNEHKTRVYKTANAQLIARLAGYPSGFSPDGQLVMTGTEKPSKVRAWRLGSTPSPENASVTTKSSSPEAAGSAIGPKAVWNPPEVVWARMQGECNHPDFVECVATIMQQAGASAEAIEFTRLIKGEGYMDSFREMGKVDLATVFDPFRANDNGYVLLVNGTSQMINPEDLDKLGKIDIRLDPLYPSLARRFPQIMLWSNPSFESMQRLPTGGQRFIMQYVLLNGCHACAVAGNAHVAFDFDGTGNFIGIKLLRLSGVQPVRRQPRRTR